MASQEAHGRNQTRQHLGRSGPASGPADRCLSELPAPGCFAGTDSSSIIAGQTGSGGCGGSGGRRDVAAGTPSWLGSGHGAPCLQGAAAMRTGPQLLRLSRHWSAPGSARLLGDLGPLPRPSDQPTADASSRSSRPDRSLGQTHIPWTRTAGTGARGARWARAWSSGVSYSD